MITPDCSEMMSNLSGSVYQKEMADRFSLHRFNDRSHEILRSFGGLRTWSRDALTFWLSRSFLTLAKLARCLSSTVGSKALPPPRALLLPRICSPPLRSASRFPNPADTGRRCGRFPAAAGHGVLAARKQILHLQTVLKPLQGKSRHKWMHENSVCIPPHYLMALCFFERGKLREIIQRAAVYHSRNRGPQNKAVY
jgi:hypothetical protein